MKSYVLPEPGSKVTSLQIAGMIDQSLIRPDMTVKEIKDGCSIAIEYGCASVSVKESEVPVAADMLKGSGVRIGSCLSFPHGCEPTSLKVLSAKNSADMGVEEIDMVMNIGRFKSGEYGYVEDDIGAVAEVCHANGMVLKAILENYYLTGGEIAAASKIMEKAGADFIKTSSGYAPGGAKIGDLRIMRASVTGAVQIKAAGGVRTLDKALAVLAVGGTRFGCTQTVSIMAEARQREAAGTLAVPYTVGDDAI